jgi:hypothetical protein
LGKRHADSFETGDAGGEIDEIAMCEAWKHQVILYVMFGVSCFVGPH